MSSNIYKLCKSDVGGYEVFVAGRCAGRVYRASDDKMFPWRADPANEGIKHCCMRLASTRREAIDCLLRSPATLGDLVEAADSGPVTTAEYRQWVNWHGERTGYIKRVHVRKVVEVIDALRDCLARWWIESSSRFGVELSAQDRDLEGDNLRWLRDAGTEGIVPAYCSPIDEVRWVEERADGSSCGWWSRDEWPAEELVTVRVVRGANEGHYIHVESEDWGGSDRCAACSCAPRKIWLVIKTFLGADHAWALAREITRLLGEDE